MRGRQHFLDSYEKTQEKKEKEAERKKKILRDQSGKGK